MIVVGGIDAHAGTGDAIFAEGDTGDYAFFRKSAIAIVAIELVGLRVVGKKQVGPTVVIVIKDGDAHGFGGGLAESRFLADILKRAVAAIVPETCRGAFVGFRRAVGFAFAVESAIKIGLLGPLHVVTDHEVETAVFIVVHPGRSSAQFTLAPSPVLLRYVGEGPI